MQRCANCNKLIAFGGHPLGDKVYCSSECLEFAQTPEFCAKCQEGTVAVRTGNLVTVNFIGESFIGSSNKCPTCHSVERYMFFFFGFPLIPLGKWKVKYVQPNRFITRKIMTSAFPDTGRQHLQGGKAKGRMNPLVWLLIAALALAVIFPVIYQQIYK